MTGLVLLFKNNIVVVYVNVLTMSWVSRTTIFLFALLFDCRLIVSELKKV